MTINLSLPQKESEIKPRITVIGVGGAGGVAGGAEEAYPPNGDYYIATR